jgi:hypothetical protein
VYIKQLDQIAYTSYSQLSQFSVSTNFGSPVDTISSSYNYHSAYPVTYDITYSTTINSFAGRSLDYTILNFTSGIQSIQTAYIRYPISPFVVNPTMNIKIFKDSYNCWCLKITGMNDNTYSTSNSWTIRMRYFPNSGTLNYYSTTYAKNG